MKNKIIGIIVCTLLMASAVPAVTSLSNSTVPSMVPHVPVTSRGENWTELQKLLASDGEAYDEFGCSVSISGDTALIGAIRDSDNGQYSGSVYVFTHTDTNWTLQQKLLASDGQAHDYFGYSVSLSGDTALIGAIGVDSFKGAAYVFTRTGTIWTQQQKLFASDGAVNDEFGCSVSVSGESALIGAYGHDSNEGSAYVFIRSGATWTQQAQLLASDGATNDQFGLSVALSGDTALIGAHWDDDNGKDDSGSAYVFTRTGTTWSQQQKLHASDAEAYDAFGGAVSLSGDTALIGAPKDDMATTPGSSYVFTRSGNTWAQEAKLLASDGIAPDFFGCAVSIDGDTALVGAFWGDGIVTDSGSAYVFARNGTNWTQQAKLVASDGEGSDEFGYSVSLSADIALIGAFQDDNAKGSAYVFTSESVNQPPVAEFNWTPPNPTAYHQITFNASASYDTDGTITSYEWDWNNDGVYDETHSTPITTHVWTGAGSYPVSLRVTDNEGATGTITKTVNVSTVSITFKANSGLGVTVVFTNKGTMNVTNVPWQIYVKGGKYGHVNTTTYGLLDLEAGDSGPRGTSLILGLGVIKITVQVADQEQTFTGIQIIVFTLVLP